MVNNENIGDSTAHCVRIEQGITDGASNIYSGVQTVTMKNDLQNTGSSEHISMNGIFYQRLIEASPDPIYIYVNEIIVFANHAAAKLLGADHAEIIIGCSIWDFVPASSRPALEKGIDLIINRDRQYIIADDRVMRLDGKVLNVEISSSFFKYKGHPGILAFFRDITKRYKAEEQLRKSENVYRTIFEATGTAMIFFEEDTTISLMNSKCLKLSGYAKEEVEGKMSWMEFVAGKDIQRLRQYHDLRTVNPELVPRNYEFSLKDREGSLRDVFMTIAVIPETNQRVASIVDISDRKNAERALAASEEKYRLVVENAKEAIVIIQDDVIKYVNPKVCDITGYSEESLLERDFFGYIHPEFQSYVADEYKRRLENTSGRSIGPIKIFDTHHDVRWLEIYSVRIRWEDKPAVLLFLTDITDRKAAEEALAASEAKYRVLAENAGDIIMMCDMEGVITYVNRTGCEITGMTADDIRGRSINDLIQPGKNVSLKNSIIEKKINDSNLYRHKAQIENKDGDIIQLETISNVIRLEKNTKGVLVIARDITERNRLEREIINVSERIRMQVGRDLHDDISPHIIAIGAFAEVLKRKLEKKDLPEAEDMEKIREFLSEASVKIRRLVKGLCPVDLDAKGVISALDNLAERINTIYGIACGFEYDKSIMIYDNTLATSVYYIAQEAVYNAAKHSGASSIAISFFPDSEGNYILNVSDDGKGFIPSEIRSKGQGLKIMRYRADVINGSFDIRRNEPEGTMITVTIPAATLLRQGLIL